MTANIFHSLLSLFYPNCCAGCGRDLSIPDQSICLNCMAKLPETGFAFHPGNPVEKLFTGRMELTAACSQFYFTRSSIIQTIIHQLKYKGNRKAGIEMGKLMGHTLKQSIRFGNIDAIIPLPLFPEKELLRGYNQAEVLSRGIQEILQIPVYTDAVIRNRFTTSQTNKSRMERWQNVEQVFSIARPELLVGRKLLLTDDVITTGATLEACGNAIIRGTKAELFLASLAYAMQ